MSSAGVFDFHTDQGARWRPRLTVWTDPTKTTLVDLTGYGARLTVARSGFAEDPVLELAAPADIVLGDALGTVAWVVPAATMAELVHSLYNYELVLVPGADETQAFSLLKGRLLVSEAVAA